MSCKELCATAYTPVCPSREKLINGERVRWWLSVDTMLCLWCRRDVQQASRIKTWKLLRTKPIRTEIKATATIRVRRRRGPGMLIATTVASQRVSQSGFPTPRRPDSSERTR